MEQRNDTTKRGTARDRAKRAERRFVRRTVLFSTLIALIGIACGTVLYLTRDTRLPRMAEKRMASGEFDRAIAILETLDPSDERDAMLLECRYQSALAVLERGDHAEAETLFSAIADYRDSRTRILECRYCAAEAVEASGDHKRAGAMFYALSGYADSTARYDACRYAEAAALADAGETEAAFRLFAELGDHADALARAGALAVQLTGIDDPERALPFAMGYSSEALKAIEALATARKRLPDGVLGVGFYHTVALKADGTVLAAGLNGDGQCDVSAWRDIVWVDAGAYHTVALKSDGTVLAAGRNAEGQCDVSAWTDVVAVACADYNTVALCSDGTVRSAGYQQNDAVSGWADIIAIGAGAYQTVAVRGNGQLLASHSSARSDALTGLIAADASTGYAVGLRSDGTVLHTAADLSAWQSVIRIAASANGTFGITADGTLLAHFFEARNAIDLSGIENAVAVAAGATHIAVRLGDGRVVVRGDNAFGQCDTGDWHVE